MSLNLEHMQPVEVFDEDSFFQFIIAQSPIKSLWMIELGFFSPEDDSFLRQLDNPQKIKKTSSFEITLTLPNKTTLLAQLPSLTFPTHHMVCFNDEAFMVAYDSFSACWISRALTHNQLKPLIDDNVIKLCID